MRDLVKDKTIVFIIGDGHSGSTILNLAMGTAQNAVSVGEIVHVSKYKEKNGVCSCGKRIFDCEFWNPIINEIPLKIWEGGLPLYQNQNVIFPFKQIQLLKNHLISLKKENWIQNNKLIFSSIFNNSNASIIVDSAKILNRSLLLKKYLNSKLSSYTL